MTGSPLPRQRLDHPAGSAKASEAALARGWLVSARLHDSVRQLIRLRWLAGLGVLIVAIAIGPLLQITEDGRSTDRLMAVGILILAYNAVFYFFNRRYRKTHAPTESYLPLAVGQMILDWLAMILLIHYSGGIESPALYFFLFHLVIASIFFRPRLAFSFAVFAVLLVSGIACLEFVGLLPHYPVTGFLAAEPHEQPTYQNLLFVTVVLTFFGFTAIFITYLATRIAEDMRRSAAEAQELSESLQSTSNRLRILNESARTINSTLELNQVLNRLVENTAGALGVKAAAIRLVDEQTGAIQLAAVYGLSQAYQDALSSEMKSSPLDKKVLEGMTINIPDVSQTDLLLHPMYVQQEGISSILTAPLLKRGGQGEPQAVPMARKAGTLGTLRVYAAEKRYFTSADQDFLTAIAAQGSIAIENALAYKEIASLEEIKSIFIRTATHELRSPVGVTLSLLNNIAEGHAGEITEMQKNLLERAIRRTEFLKELIDDLLDLAAGKVEDHRYGRMDSIQPVALLPVLQRLVARFEILAQEKSLALKLDASDEPSAILVRGTPDGLDRIFNNLIGNAVKYTPSGGRVTITLSADNEQVFVSVRDTGIGIPEEALPNLFTEFYRAQNARQIESKGTGLGLTIVRDLVEGFGGKISLESQLGVGSCFTVALPQAHSTA